MGDLIAPFADLYGASVLRAIAGSVLLLFLPGFGWSLVFFRRLTLAERIALSVGISIAIVTLSLLFLNITLGFPLTGTNAVLVSLLLTVVPVVIYFLRRKPAVRKGR